MSEFEQQISRFNSFARSGAYASANSIGGEIAREFLQSLYPITQDGESLPEYLVHYTGLDALFSMLDRDRPDFLRLYDTVHSNDPSEGRFFRQHLETAHPEISARLPEEILNPHPGYAYISSFVSAHDRSKADKLAYWLAYGRNGYGCSIAIPFRDFAPNLPIMPVQYGKSAATASAQKLATFLGKFCTEPHTENQTLAALRQELGAIPFFHKPKSYKYESECRLYLSPLESEDPPLFEPRYHSGGSPQVRHYVEVPDLQLQGIFFTGTLVTLGPSISSRSNVKRAIDALLTYHGLRGPEVICSRIPYRPASV